MYSKIKETVYVQFFKHYSVSAIVILALFVLNCAAASASEIAPGRSCNGIRLGETQEGVKTHLGAPDQKDTIGGYETWTYYLNNRSLIMAVQWNSQRKVESVLLMSLTVPPSDKVRNWARNTNTYTSKGITFGTPVSEVIAKMGQPAGKANTKNGLQLVYPGLLLCAQDGVVFYLRVSSNAVGS